MSFLSKIDWINIERGFEYDAAIPYPSDTKRPLSFFIPDEDDISKGRIVNSTGDFSPELLDNGKRKAKEQKVVMTFKPRKVVVLTDNEINQHQDYEYILVAPINTIKHYETTKDWYSKLKDDQHPIFTYLPKGRLERYVDLSQSMSIHKSLLLEKYKEISQERLAILEGNLLQCLSLGIIDEESSEELLIQEDE